MCQEWTNLECLQVQKFLTALKNSFLIAGSASIICGVLGLLIGYAVVRLPGTLISGFLRQISFLPYLMPGLAFAAAYLSLFAVARGPIPALYGSISLLIFGNGSNLFTLCIKVRYFSNDASWPRT